MNKIVEILMRRDGISLSEACSILDECREEVEMARTLDEAEDAIYYHLGLEPDYLMDVLEV